MRSAGKGLLALPALPYLFVFWIIPFEISINTIRTLSIDAVQQANSGHPGTPMALAPLVYTIWNRVMRFDPAGPDLAQPRPLRALQRSCLDAALVGAPPDRHASA
jgi:hypothetical protein